jgi:2-polyprenylphenol 6-hydroxylase
MNSPVQPFHAHPAPQSASTVDVLIVGAGIVGASLALALAEADVSVALMDSRGPDPAPDEDQWDSRVYALSPGNASWLAELGVWQRLRPERVTRVESMHIFGDQAPGRLEFDAYDAGLRELAWIVESSELQHALWQRLESAPYLELFNRCACEAIDWGRDTVRVTLADRRALDARLVVAADGSDSWVRAQAGIASRTYDYPQTGVVANFETERKHDDAAFQWFRSDGVLAFLPMPGQRVSMVWSATADRAAALMSAPEAELAREVAEASAYTLGGLHVITLPRAFPLRRQRVAQLVEPRVALIGDAAHTVHPLAGQGMNLGLRDARELAGVIAGRGPQRDCGDYRLLRRYERARREDILALELTTDTLQKLFGTATAPVARLRNAGLALTNAQPLLKKLLVRHAVG